MLDKVRTEADGNLFCHIKPQDTVFRRDGLREFFLYRDLGIAAATGETLVAAGDCVHQRPGIRHYLFDYSPDMEYLEIVAPADFKTIDVDPVCEIPAPQGWC